jgi:hypothetical protein
MKWFNELPAELRASAYPAGEEHAWNRGDALKVLSWLEQRGLVVLGVDVWIPTILGPTIPAPYVYDWDIDAVREPSAPQRASEFVSSFKWHPADEHRQELPYFAIGPVELRS